MAFPMMGPDLPDHHLYHAHYPARSTVKSFCSTSCSVIVIASFPFILLGGLLLSEKYVFGSVGASLEQTFGK